MLKRAHCLAGAVFTRQSTFPHGNIRQRWGRRGTAKNLADVFISSSRLDRERVEPMAERLVSLGYSVWWDKQSREGQAFVDEVERELADAKAVIAVWSENARNSSWMLAQTSAALDAERLLQLRLDDSRLPRPFDVMPAADMFGGKSEWGPLDDALARLVREGRAPQPLERMPALSSLPSLLGMPRLLLTAATLTLVAYAGALSAAYTGVMTPDQLQIAVLGVFGVGGLTALLTALRLFSIRRAGG
jgi:hypothetical protein